MSTMIFKGSYDYNSLFWQCIITINKITLH